MSNVTVFSEDKSGNVHLLPRTIAAVDTEAATEPGEVDTSTDVKVDDGGVDGGVFSQQRDDWAAVDVAPSSDLRGMLVDLEATHGIAISTGIRRLRERRVNRTLSIVANWLLVGADQLRDRDPAAAALLMSLSEDVRDQIQWPELETYMRQQNT